MSKTPAKGGLDPIFCFAFQATGHLPTHKQQLFALYYVRALQRQRQAVPQPLTELVPANLYRGIRHFLADTDWDHREVVWAAAAQALEHFEIDWLASSVTAIGPWMVAWLAAYDGPEVLPLDLVVIGPTERVGATELVSPQRDILRRATDVLLRSAPLGLGGDLAEDAATRAALAKRKVTYSAKIRPSSPLAGRIEVGGQRLSPAAFASVLRKQPRRTWLADSGVTWGACPVKLVSGVSAALKETVVFAWDGDRLAEAYLTNARAPECRGIYGPAEAPLITRARARMPWRRTSLRGARAWEHHLALVSVLQAFRVKEGVLTPIS